MISRRRKSDKGGNLVSAKEAAARKKNLGQEIGNQFRGFGYKPVEPQEDRIRLEQLTAKEKRKLIPRASIPGEREADLERVRAIRKSQFKPKRSEKKQTLSERQQRVSRKQERDPKSERLYMEVRQIEAERQALRRMEINGGDEVALGSKSSGWLEFKVALKAKLLFLDKANIRRADDAASTLNRMGFKTGSGQLWTPRLIKIAKMKLFDPSGRTAR